MGTASGHAGDLRMVKGVKGFQPQFELAATSFADQEVLEHRQVPVVTARATHGVIGQVAPYANGRDSKRRIRNPLGFGVRRYESTHFVGAVVSADTVTAWVATQRNVERQTRFNADDARNLPATDNRSRERVGRVPHEGQVVDEVERQVMQTIITRGSNVILPSGVWVGDAYKVASSSATIGLVGGVNRTRYSVEHAQAQVPLDLRIQIYL